VNTYQQDFTKEKLMYMSTSKEQIRAAQEIINNNQSMRWDGKFGHYSNGQVVMTVHWDFDKTKEEFKITLNRDGTQVYY